MSFGRDIASGVATEIGGLIIIAFLLGMAFTMFVYGVYMAVLWLLNHVALV